jgi:hypothetical protein
MSQMTGRRTGEASANRFRQLREDKGSGFQNLQAHMYCERFEIVSDPFDDGDCIAVHATSGNNHEIRTLCLPTALLVCKPGRFLEATTMAVTRHISGDHNHLTSVSEKGEPQ